MFAGTATIGADSLAADAPPHVVQIRTTDDRLRRILEDGVRLSPTFRALVEKINRSDVVAYLQADTRAPAGVDGRLTFVAAHPPYRYVMVRISLNAVPWRQIALVGHELQHVVEIADAPDIVDATSMARAYARFGYANRGSVGRGATFDTKAAVQAGYAVLHELIAEMETGD